MSNLTIKGIPLELLERLRAQALSHRRSLNQEVLACLESQLRAAPLSIEELQARVRARRERMGAASLTIADLDAAKREGRP